MTEQLITEIQRKMLPYLNNEQLMHLRDAMAETLEGATITYDGRSNSVAEETDAVEAFITAKRIEGCSEKTLSYYRKTIESLIAGVGKAVQQITTDDLRRYLTNYQVQRRSSKVTIDNIRRILSSFFSWLEDEDFIVKSPVRRIHKVKTAKVVKDTYTDEALELMRDNCTTARDLAMIDLLASSGMRVGELVTLNREDINFNERECVVIGKGNKERLVYFDARTKIHLQNYLEGRTDGNPALFVTLPEVNERINELLKHSIKSEGVINLFSDVQTEFSLFDPKFLEEVANMKEKNLAVELLKKLISEQVSVYRRTNIVKSEKFSEIIQSAMNRYLNGMLTNEEVIQELLKLAKDIAAAAAEGEKLGLTAEELAFYDALTKPQAIKDFYEHDELIAITKELTDLLRKNRTIDWQKKESARAGMRRLVKRLLKKHKYPPDGMDDAVQTVMSQCEMWVDNT